MMLVFSQIRMQRKGYGRWNGEEWRQGGKPAEHTERYMEIVFGFRHIL